MSWLLSDCGEPPITVFLSQKHFFSEPQKRCDNLLTFNVSLAAFRRRFRNPCVMRPPRGLTQIGMEGLGTGGFGALRAPQPSLIHKAGTQDSGLFFCAT